MQCNVKRPNKNDSEVFEKNEKFLEDWVAEH